MAKKRKNYALTKYKSLAELTPDAWRRYLYFYRKN